MLAQKDRQERDPGLQKGLELRDAITEQHKEERGQLKDLRVTAFVSVVIPLHCQRPSLRVLSWPEINGAFI